MSISFRGFFAALGAVGWIAAGPTARLLQTVAWETVQDYYGK